MAKPEVFIIESLNPDDEGNGRMDGRILADFLRLHDKTPIYRYVRTLKQFKSAVREFGESDYRYLHISAHGDKFGMELTDQTHIDFAKFGKILKPFLDKRRLFLSACSMVRRGLAEVIIPHTGCYSVVGPKKKIHFMDAAVFWITVYHLVFKAEATKMTRRILKQELTRAGALFELEIGYFATSEKNTSGMTTVDLSAK